MCKSNQEGLNKVGLYLCIFDQNGDDICGVEVGLYSYFGEFRDLVSKFTNKNVLSKVLKRKSKFINNRIEAGYF